MSPHTPSRNSIIRSALVAGCLACSCTAAADPDQAPESAFLRDLVPFLESHCAKCHSGEEPEAGISFEKYREASHVQRDHQVWEKVRAAISDGLMPPEDEPRPTDSELHHATAAIDEELAKFDCTEAGPGRVTLRRINRVEYNNTIRDLLDIDFQPADDFPSDDVGEGFDNIGDVLTIPTLLLEKYLNAAEVIVTKVLENDKTRHRIAPVPVVDGVSAEIMRSNLSTFARRAFRRTARPDEIDRLMGLIKYAEDNGSSRTDAFAAAVQAVLTSPHFLFLVESDPEEASGSTRRLTDFELASRLSYFLWSSMPDEQLLGLAERDELSNPPVLDAQVLRMLADPKAESLVDNFVGQWLQLRDLRHLRPDPMRFPNFDEALRSAMLRETQMFLTAIFREDRSVLEILGADFTFVNERLAQHYGLDGITGETFQRVSMPAQRRGVLTHGSILFLTSNPTRTSPVKRGKWILDNILGEPPPPPPEGIEELDEEGEVLGTMRERLAQHRSNQSCAVCHQRMDPIGFGLENFDAVGAWRERDGRFEIDASGNLLGGRVFHGPSQLMEILVDEKQDEFCRCLAKKLLTYALGRGVTAADHCAVDDILAQLSENDYRFSALVTAIVNSDPFTLRQMVGDN